MTQFYSERNQNITNGESKKHNKTEHSRLYLLNVTH